MQIVIDIPEEEYNMIKIKSELDIGGVSSEAERIIANASPLPKGHGRLIDADTVWDIYHSNDYDFYEALDDAPTIIAESEEEE